MQNYKAKIIYDGSRYSGWQRQENNEKTIQYRIEQIISKMVDTQTSINGSGRTDAGVHARGQVINFKIDTYKSEDEIKEYINEYLPEDIVVADVSKAEDRFHARLSAKGKRYIYYIDNGINQNVFNRKYSYYLRDELDVMAMREGAKHLIGEHDFAAFTSKKHSKKSTIRTITSIDINKAGNQIQFEFEGDGFLYHMIRILMGTLLEVGIGKREASDMVAIIESKKRAKSGYLVPPQGLFLEEVYY